jgi:hypothetical protein
VHHQTASQDASQTEFSRSVLLSPHTPAETSYIPGLKNTKTVKENTTQSIANTGKGDYEEPALNSSNWVIGILERPCRSSSSSCDAFPTYDMFLKMPIEGHTHNTHTHSTGTGRSTNICPSARYDGQQAGLLTGTRRIRLGRMLPRNSKG